MVPRVWHEGEPGRRSGSAVCRGGILRLCSWWGEAGYGVGGEIARTKLNMSCDLRNLEKIFEHVYMVWEVPGYLNTLV
jgi:hypothetical protein